VPSVAPAFRASLREYEVIHDIRLIRGPSSLRPGDFATLREPIYFTFVTPALLRCIHLLRASVPLYEKLCSRG